MGSILHAALKADDRRVRRPALFLPAAARVRQLLPVHLQDSRACRTLRTGDGARQALLAREGRATFTSRSIPFQQGL